MNGDDLKPWEKNPPNVNQNRQQPRQQPQQPRQQQQRPNAPPGYNQPRRGPPGYDRPPTEDINKKKLPSAKKKRLLKILLYSLVGTGTVAVLSALYFVFTYVL